MIIATTPTLEGRPVRDYLGIVTGEVIVGANIFKDLFAAFATSSAAGPVLMNPPCAAPANRRFANCRTRPAGWVPMR